MIEETLLRDGGLLIHDPEFMSTTEADVQFAQLLETVPWRQEGPRGRLFPRLTAWYADAGVHYSYSGVTHEPSLWLPQLLELKRRVEGTAGTQFNSLLLNLYRDGRDSIGMHADDEPELGVNPVIGSMSLGGVRRFVLRHKRSGERLSLDLAHGSLIIMAGTSQHYWVHGVPKTAKPVGKRINLTFRSILTKL
jgi:alkylated DNA repair dioxygenase AlkB